MIKDPDKLKNKQKCVFSWMNQNLEARKTAKYGKGVFATRNIKKDETLAVFGGYILTLKEVERLPEKYSDTGFQVSDKFSITSKNRSEDSDCFNHSCNPNAGLNGQIFLVSMRDIKRGEEVTFDYAMVLSKGKGIKKYKFKCLCGSDDCRGYVTENDWKIPALQEKYDGYFQFFLQNKINNLRNKNQTK